MNLQITQSIAIKKFAAHETKNLFIRCCAKTLQPDWKFEPERNTKAASARIQILTRWLKQISSHEIFKEWGILLKFQTWQEVEVPPKLIKRGINIPFEKRLPLRRRNKKPDALAFPETCMASNKLPASADQNNRGRRMALPAVFF